MGVEMKKQALKFGAITLLGLGILKLVLIFLNWLIMFLLVGVIPGTSYSIPPSIMLLVTVTAMWIILLIVLPYDRFFRPTPTAPDEMEKPLARRRFTDL